LLDRLGSSGAELLVATLDGIESGELEAREQPADGISLAPKITPADAEVDWRKPAIGIDRQIRACTPEPGAWTQLNGLRVKLWPVTVQAGLSGAPAGLTGPESPPLAAGRLLVLRNRVLAGTGSGPVELGDVQADGKRRMSAADWARGLHTGSRALVLG
jgi:methionyl-tRNA formyltransferase